MVPYTKGGDGLRGLHEERGWYVVITAQLYTKRGRWISSNTRGEGVVCTYNRATVHDRGRWGVTVYERGRWSWRRGEGSGGGAG